MKSSALLLVDKPSGPTSHDLVYWARKVLGLKAIGHTGTLDPLASGLMVLVLGEATKLSQYLMEGEKEYEVLFELGKISNTYDREGELHATEISIPDLSIIKTEILKFKGLLNLKVPAFSAVKVDGQSLMERARKNIETPDVFRDMDFYEVELLQYTCPFVKVRLKCSKGAYVRSWVHELGVALGCGAIVSELRRTLNSGFHVAKAYPLTRDSKKEDIQISQSWIPIEQSLLDWPRIPLTDGDMKSVRNGQIPSPVALQAYKTLTEKNKNMAFLQCQQSQKLACIVSLAQDSQVRLNRVFTY